MSKREQETIINLRIGFSAANKGIFLGEWQPKNREGKSLGKTFNVFAAPEDLADFTGKRRLLTFEEAAKEVASLRNWNGHDGGNFNLDTELYNSLKEGSGTGKWFIPTLELLNGYSEEGKLVRPRSNLYTRRNVGDFKGTIATSRGNFGVLPLWYWSSTEFSGHSECVWSFSPSDGSGDWNHKNTNHGFCRPCRVELAPRTAIVNPRL